jgi:hypothetical protein
MPEKYEIPANELRWLCDLSYLPFTCTADMTPLEDFIGPRARDACHRVWPWCQPAGLQYIRHGSCRNGQDQHYTGISEEDREPAGIGGARSAPDDWCYLYNFADPDRPRALKIRRGWGKMLKADMDQLVQYLQREAKKTFESDEFAGQRQATTEELQKRQQELIEALMGEANRSGFSLRMTPSGVVLLPTKDGKPMQETDFLALSADDKKQLEEKRSQIEKRIEETLRDGKTLEREISGRLEELERQAGEYLVRIPFAELKEKYAGYAGVLDYIEDARAHILKDLQKFKGGGAPAALLPIPVSTEPLSDPFLPYRVNVFVDNSATEGPPIVVETNPNYHNLFGVVEKKPMMGGYITDFTLIKAGSISRANGGYLVLYDRDVLANAGVWEALQRVIKNRELRIEEPRPFLAGRRPRDYDPNRFLPTPKSS